MMRFSINGVKDTARNSTAVVATIGVSQHLTLDVWTDQAITSAAPGGTYTWCMVVNSVGATLGGSVSYVGGPGHYDVTDDTETNFVGDNYAGNIYANLLGIPSGGTGGNGSSIPSGMSGVQGNFSLWSVGAIGSGFDMDGNPLAYPTVAAGTVLFDDIDIHCEGNFGLLAVTMYKLNNDTFLVTRTDDFIIVNQIPEPATIALLCLGGLLLRKK